MILPIYTFGQPVLRKVAQDITPDYPELKTLIADMFETLTQADGVGLAAPQIGRDIRVVVIDLDVLKDDMPEYASISCASARGDVPSQPASRSCNHWSSSPATPSDTCTSHVPGATGYVWGDGWPSALSSPAGRELP